MTDHSKSVTSRPEPAIAPDHQHRYAMVIRRLDKIIDSVESEIKTLGPENIDAEETRVQLVKAKRKIERCRDYLLVTDYEAIRHA